MQRPQATPRPFPAVFSFVYLGVILSGAYYDLIGLCGGGFSARRLGLLAGALLLPLLLEFYEQRQYKTYIPRPAAIILLIVRIALYEVVVTFDCSGFSKFLYLLVPFTAYFLDRRLSYGLAVFYVGLVVARVMSYSPTWYLNQEWISDLLIFAIGLVFAILMARLVNNGDSSRLQAEKSLAALELSHQQLKKYTEQVAGLAAAEERNRLARDIHDSLGHYLTVINVQLEKALAFRERNPQETEQALWDAKRSARQALQDVRQSVSTLRHSGEVFSLSAALTELAQNMTNDYLSVDLQIVGDESDFSKMALMSLYRAAQEGLTNIQKHAHASQVTLNVTFDEQIARLYLGDNGHGFDINLLDHPPSTQQERFGLQGIRERLELVGGTMRVESNPNQGTHLFITIPKTPLTWERAAESENVSI
jgi:signal transduction histidine kinase